MRPPFATSRARRPLGLLVLLAALLALAAPAGAAAKVPSSFFGISAALPTDHDFQRMGGAGFGAYRFGVDWRGVQQTREGGFNWAGTDANVRQAATNGMQPAPIMYGSPRFVTRSDTKLIPPTESRQDRKSWQGFLAAAARRYGSDGEFWQENPGLPELPVRSWIIWNEPNARPYWRPKPNPRDYATLVAISDEALSDVDRSAKVVLGGMYGYPRDERSFPSVDFLRGLYRVRGIESHFDAINLHPYGGGVSSVKRQIAQARAAVRKAGDPSVSILIGELGWASDGPARSESVVGSSGQANRLRTALKLLLDKRRAWNIIGVHVYVWQDSESVGTCLWCPGAGLIDLGGKAKPALGAVKGVIRSTR